MNVQIAAGESNDAAGAAKWGERTGCWQPLEGWQLAGLVEQRWRGLGWTQGPGRHRH